MFFAPATRCLCLRLLVSYIFARCGKAYVMLMPPTEVVFSKCERQGNNNQILRLLVSYLRHPLQLSGDTATATPAIFMMFEAMQWCRHLQVDCFALFSGPQRACAEAQCWSRVNAAVATANSGTAAKSLAQRTGWLVFAGVGVAGFCPWCAASYCLGDFLFLMTAQHSKA